MSGPYNEDLLAECDAFIEEHRGKADANERRARLATLLLAGTSATIPILIVASTRTSEFLLGQLLPSVLAGFAALTAALVQIERPHDRWALYRGYQRRYEAERLKYLQGVGEYAQGNRDEAFALWLAGGRVRVHDEWVTLMPRAADVGAVRTPEP